MVCIGPPVPSPLKEKCSCTLQFIVLFSEFCIQTKHFYLLKSPVKLNMASFPSPHFFISFIPFTFTSHSFIFPLNNGHTFVLQMGPFQTCSCQTCFNYQLNAQFLYSITIYMLHYNPRHVSSRLSLLSTSVLYSHLQRVTISDAVIIQFDLLKMSMVPLATCRGL